MTPHDQAIAAELGCSASGLLHIAGKAPALPQPGTREFERMIAKSTADLKKRQPAPDERVPDDVAEERRLADTFLTNHVNRIRKINR